MELKLPNAIASEEPLFRSRFGGLWIDRRDADELLAGRLSRGEVTAKEAETLTHYIDHGYVIFPKAVGDEVIDAYLDLFELSWDEAPPSVYVHVERRVRPMSREFYDKITKVSCLHCCFDHAAELIFPLVVLRFLTLIYDRPPVAFQTMTMRKGSEETLHIDTGPLTLTEPMTMAASWLALEDVRPGSGELEILTRQPQRPRVSASQHVQGAQQRHDDLRRCAQANEGRLRRSWLHHRTLRGEKGRRPHLACRPAPWRRKDRGSFEHPQEPGDALHAARRDANLLRLLRCQRTALPEWRLLPRSPRGADKEGGRG